MPEENSFPETCLNPIDSLPGTAPNARGRDLEAYALETRKKFMKAYVLSKWAKSAHDVETSMVRAYHSLFLASFPKTEVTLFHAFRHYMRISMSMGIRLIMRSISSPKSNLWLEARGV